MRRNDTYEETRRELLCEAAALRQPDGTFSNPEQFDRLMDQIDALDTLQRGETVNVDTRTRAAVLEHLSRRSDAALDPNGGHVRVEERSDPGVGELVPRMAEALAHRYGIGKISAEARPFARMRLVDMARALLEARGAASRHDSDLTIVHRTLSGHTTSDFPALLTETGNRVLRQAYAAAPSGVRVIARQTTARDFRPINKLALSEAPALLEVPEHGEVKHGTAGETKASYNLKTFARIFSLTRTAIINDDLGAFIDFTRRQGIAAAELIARQLVTLLTSNPVMSDGVALFHANHGNLGTPAAIAIASLGEALKLMRLQTGPAGGDSSTTAMPINAAPKYLLVPAALEVVAKQYAATINAAKSSDVNPFSAELEVAVDPRLDGSSAASWYVSADPDVFTALEYAFLEDAPGPQYETRSGFDVLGLEMRVTLDFGCGVVDHRGLVKNAGV